MDEERSPQSARIPGQDKNKKGYKGSTPAIVVAMAVFGALLIGAIVFIIGYLANAISNPIRHEPEHTAQIRQSTSQEVFDRMILCEKTPQRDA